MELNQYCRLMRLYEDVILQAPPARVFHTLLWDVNTWWIHRFEHSSRMILEPTLGGRFYEELPGEGGAILFGMITRLKPNQLLQFNGTMGMGGAVVGSVSWTVTEDHEGSLLGISHHAMGEFNAEEEDRYRLGWRMLLDDHLKPLIETGKAS